jgi:hypothetical protein
MGGNVSFVRLALAAMPATRCSSASHVMRRLCACLAILVSVPAAGRALQRPDAWPPLERDPGRASAPSDPESATPDARSDSLAPLPGLRLAPADVVQLERRLGELRRRLVELRDERSRLGDELRRLGDVHASLDEALEGLPSSSLQASHRREDVEERERALVERLGSLEEDERRLAHAQAEIEKLLRELPPRQDARPRVISALPRAGWRTSPS